MTGERGRATRSRRQFLVAGVLPCVVGAVAGCELFSTDPSGAGAEDERGGGPAGSEAPEFAKLVKQGKLPPVADRLPESPLALEPLEARGTYGGTLRLLSVGSGEVYDGLERIVGYDNLVRWKPQMSTWTSDDVVPNIAERYEVNDDATEYVFDLRPGMKWSDGEPFTADDVVFWYEDVIMNEELTPSIPEWFRAGAEPPVVERLDDHRVAFRFSAPNGTLLGSLATPDGQGPTRHPAHYLKEFHQSHSPDVDKAVQAEGFDSWAEFFYQKASPWDNSELPVLYAWKVTSGVGEETGRVTAERNPYYWKVDTDGSQLPYIDAVSHEIIQDNEVMKVKTFGGEVDFIYRTIKLDLADKPLYFRDRESGGYGVFDLQFEDANMIVFSLNQAHKDQLMREVFGNLDFRAGLSHAINRQEIIDAVYQRQGEPFQISPHPGTPYYNEGLARQYTEYSVEEATARLDRVLPDKDDQGMRLAPDGSKFRFVVEFAVDTRPNDAPVLDLMKQYFAEVGIQMDIKPETGDLFFERLESNLHDASAYGPGGGLDPVFQPDYFFPIAGGNSQFGVPWAYWYLSGGLDGAIPEGITSPIEEPPPAAREQMELYDQLKAASDPDEQVDLMNQILEIAREQFWCMGICLPEGEYGIVSNRLQNVPGEMIDDWPWQTPGPTNPPQYFITEP